MGNCWPNCKLKKRWNNYSNNNNNNNNDSKHNKNSINNLSSKKFKKKKNETKNEKKTNSNEQINHQIVPLNDCDNIAFQTNNNEQQLNSNNKKQVLMPRRDVDANATIMFNLTVASNQQTNSNSNSNQKFKQFCKNSADKLTHKLSFNHNKANKSVNDVDDCVIIVNEGKIVSLFDKYSDSKEINYILANGVQQLCNDLNLSCDDIKILLLAWKLDAKQMCKFSRDEFLNGFKINLKVDNLKDLKQKLIQLEHDIKFNENEFKNLYRWTYDFGLDAEVGERAIAIEIAISLWELVYVNQEPAILSRWISFLKDHTLIKGISRDTWNMFPLFSKSIGDFNYNLYDDNEAWPCLFDDFVQSEISRLNDLNKTDVNNNSS